MVNGVLCNGRNRIVLDGSRNGDAGRRGTGERDVSGEQEWRTRRGETGGDGEQENRICLENRNGGRGGGRRGTGERDLSGERERRTRRGGDGEQENGICLENMKLHKV